MQPSEQAFLHPFIPRGQTRPRKSARNAGIGVAEVRISRGLDGFRAFSMAEALQRRRAAGAGRKTLRLTPHGILRLRPTACAQDDNLNPTSCGRDDRTGRCSPRLAEGGLARSASSRQMKKRRERGFPPLASATDSQTRGASAAGSADCFEGFARIEPLWHRHPSFSSFDRFAFDESYIRLTTHRAQYKLT